MTIATMPRKPSSIAEANLTLLALGILGAVIGWTFWPTIAELGHKWFHDPGYSHGILVPLFAMYVLWVRRTVPTGSRQPDFVMGIVCLLVAIAFRVVGALLCFTWIDALALL